jgi:hypothetical protein
MKSFVVTFEAKPKSASGGWRLHDIAVIAPEGATAKARARTKAEEAELEVRGITGIKEQPPVKHTIEHALRPALCNCGPQDIVACVVCDARLEIGRKHTDTCSEPCYRTLLRKQREP